MKLLVFTVVAVLLHVSLVSCFSVDAELSRLKRSNVTEEGFIQKVKGGFKAAGSKISNVASKGYGEFKNLFSKDRKVGDYQLNNMDVRIAEEEDYEEVAVKRPKRDVRKSNLDVSQSAKVDLDELVKDIEVLQITENPDRKKSKLDNNAESAPGLPQAFVTMIKPLVCAQGARLVDGECKAA